MAFVKTGTPEKRNIIAYSNEVPDESVFDEKENEDGESERDGCVSELDPDDGSRCPQVSRR